MDIKYTLWNPNGNITALVQTPVAPDAYPETAALIMKKEPTCEQVGFLNGRALRMAGGEFCGNASICAAAQFFRDECTPKNPTKYTFPVSGSDAPVCAEVEKNGEKYAVTLEMPPYESIFYKELPLGGNILKLPVVSFPGIMHVIIENFKLEDAAFESAVKEWSDILDCDAVGAMLLDADSGRLKPLVYVKSAATLFWEGSCASGTAAAGVYIAEKTGKKAEICFKEPKAPLTVIAAPGNPPHLKGFAEIIKTDKISM